MRTGTELSNTQIPPVSGVCPGCGKYVTFATLSGGATDFYGATECCGVRRCPDRDCGQVVFIEYDHKGQKLTEMWPRPTAVLPSLSVPPSVGAALKESITCANEKCFMAAAVMVRRTLEMICEDKNIAGDNLVQRIEGLKANAILPPALIAGMHSLRLLGNDAAHVKAKVFSEVGEPEVGAALALAHEIVKAVYGYDDLVGRIEQLKKPR